MKNLLLFALYAAFVINPAQAYAGQLADIQDESKCVMVDSDFTPPNECRCKFEDASNTINKVIFVHITASSHDNCKAKCEKQECPKKKKVLPAIEIR
ncbi:MAG: hypothetical protein AB7L92_02065 [Alphaproteobacteria bacterium]